ncbi:MarR family winged helix-turn-helix transcriptional regulator [Rhodococcus phenolicus]|uniref:MarR family winged helix-turn-helix transcriptional regulator n=1 Tax=Rhodococcus phenolicus TaxID=263849 RepID=UPI0008351B49|nr:MarR family transcriptional regulator [Rhodococcus phenolicus]
MNGVELLLLGRKLTKIGEDALPTAGLPEYSTSVRTVVIVLADVAEHPDSAICEIATRTGLPQSAVSGAVARLREADAVVSEPDPADRRRSLIRQNPVVSPRVREVAETTIDAALARVLVSAEEGVVAEIKEALDTLARHLLRA